VNRLRNIGFLLWLALALAMGQQAAVLHDLTHAVKRIDADSKDQHPPPDTCEKCSTFAKFSGALPGFTAAFVLESAPWVAALFVPTPAQSRTVVHSRSRAPPQAL
jgi:hypothetical protein